MKLRKKKISQGRNWINSYFLERKLDKFIFLRDEIEKKNYFIGIELDKIIFLKNEIEKKYFIGMKLKKIEYDKD